MIRHYAVILFLFLLGSCSGAGSQNEKNAGMVSHTFQESDKAFANPLKGYRGPGKNPYIMLEGQYVPWNEIETHATDGIERIREYSDHIFNPFYEQGIKSIPRVYLCLPHLTQNADNSRIPMTSFGVTRYSDTFWPDDMTMGDYTSPQFQDRVKKLVAKMGQVWNNDDRIAYIEMGLIGFWGEQHSPYPSPEIQTVLAEAFLSAFPDKKVMIRNYNYFTDYTFGFYWDSFGLPEEDHHLEGIMARDSWRTCVMGGEVAYDWGSLDIQPGASPDLSLSTPRHLEHLIDCARLLHQNHLGWISNYTLTDPVVAAGAAELQKNLGYRFVIDQARFTGNIKKGALQTELHIRNVGSSPLYADYPLEVSLIDPVSGEKVWSGVSESAKTTAWMPGDRWNKETKTYEQPPVVTIVKDSWQVRQVKKGTYLVAVTLVDPSKGTPAMRFAHDNYLKGGYTILGKVGVGQTITDHTITDISFDDISLERVF